MRQSHKASMFDLDRQVRGRSASTGALPKINTLPTVGRTQLGNVGVLERQILLREEDAGGGRVPPEGRLIRLRPQRLGLPFSVPPPPTPQTALAEHTAHDVACAFQYLYSRAKSTGSPMQSSKLFKLRMVRQFVRQNYS